MSSSEGEHLLHSLPDDVAAHVQFYINNGMVGRVLATHVPDSTGHCAGCTSYEGARPVWPCPLAYYAGVARKLELRVARRTPASHLRPEQDCEPS